MLLEHPSLVTSCTSCPAENAAGTYVSEPTVKELGLAIDNIIAALKEEQGKRNQAARENAEREKKQQEEREARTATAIGQFMANPHLLPTGKYNGGFYIDRDRHALIFPQNTEVFAECERRVAAEKEREEKEEQLKRERKEQRQKEKWDFLRNFITKHGDKSEQERLAENLLSEEEAVSIVRDHTFAPLDRFDRYEKTDAIHGDECYRSGECDESWDVEPAASVNRGVWDSTSEIRRTAKEMGAEWTFQTHTCITSECEEETRKFGLLVSKKVGPFTLSREYECRE